jgi:hypothetical protein
MAPKFLTQEKTKVEIGVGMPAFLHLQEFGSIVWSVFGEPPFLVGSSLTGKIWRDVDVRLILADEEYDAMFGDYKKPQHINGKWAGLCMAFSSLGTQMTGLPIDFQIQRRSEANSKFDGPRSALGHVATRFKADL